MLGQAGKDRSNFDTFCTNWSKKIASLEHEFHPKLLATVALSYELLDPGLQRFVGLLACFAPEDLPVLSICEFSPDVIKKDLAISADDVVEYVARLRELSLCRYDDDDDLFSMHRLVQSCVRELQDNSLDGRYRVAIKLLAKRFGKSARELTNQLISHVDTLATVVRDEKPKLFEMSEEERSEADRLCSQKKQKP